MLCTIKNEYITLDVETHGAEMMSVKNAEGTEMLWQADDAQYWDRRAPFLFPWAGRLNDQYYTYNGKKYDAPLHGFAKDCEHKVVAHTADKLVLELLPNESTLAVYPFDFVLTITYELKGKTVNHCASVKNPSADVLRFGAGYHPGFLVPFDDKHTASDYELRFSNTESPIELGTQPNGLFNGTCSYMGKNIDTIPMFDGMFDGVGSNCMCNLTSETISIVEKNSGKSVSLNIANFPYTVIWSANTPAEKPLKYICIEPWHTIPSDENGSHEWNEKAAISIKAGETFETCLAMTFER